VLFFEFSAQSVPLEMAGKRSAKRIIPKCSVQGGYHAIPPVGADWHGARDVQKKFLPLLNKTGITVMFCGDTHRFLSLMPICTIFLSW
jgi:hypothetical protein